MLAKGYETSFAATVITTAPEPLTQQSERIELLSAEAHRLGVANARLERSNAKLAADRNELAMRLVHAEDRATSLHEHCEELRAMVLETGDAEKLVRERDEARSQLNAEQKSAIALNGRMHDAMVEAFGGWAGGLVDAVLEHVKRSARLGIEVAELKLEVVYQQGQRALALAEVARLRGDEPVAVESEAAQ